MPKRHELAIVMLLLAVTACGNDDKIRGSIQDAPVRVREITENSMPRILKAVGNVRASASVGLVPRVAGEIVAINFREGQDVREGQALVQIDPRPYEAVLRETRGQLAKSQAQLAKALDDRRRFGKLAGSGYVSREAFEQTATDAAALRATVQSDKAAVENAELDLAFCTVTAPISGRIGALNIDKGNMVKSNSSDPIANIDAISPCYVTFSIAEAHLPAIMENMAKGQVAVAVRPPGGREETGLLTLVDNNVDSSTGTIRLRATFANENRRLWPGQFVEISLPLGEMENALVVPSRAVQSGRDESYLYVVDENAKAAYRKISVLFENDGQSVVAGDLKPGQKVVVDGHVRLVPGMPVKIMD